MKFNQTSYAYNHYTESTLSDSGNIHSPQWMVIGKRVSKAKILKGKYEAKLEGKGGGVGKTKLKNRRKGGGYGCFWNNTFHFMHTSSK